LNLDDKGLASAELIFITFIILIVLAGMTSVISGELSKTKTADLAKGRALGEQIAGAINTVYINGNGYSANITIPANITSPASTITINDTTDSVNVIYNGQTVSVKVIPKNVTTFSTTSSTTAAKILTINNVNGTITFTAV